jgi:hypothetical protein
MLLPTITRNGLTVKQLKELIKDWPEEYENGDETEVWIDDGPGTSQVREVWPLNKNGNKADLLLSLSK